MGKVFLIVFSLIVFSCLGQPGKFKEFKRSAYPSTIYSIKSDTFNFRNYKLHLTQVKLKKSEGQKENQPACRIWLMVKKDSVVIDKLYYNDCEAVGGCSGIFASHKQPWHDYYILSKFGDYNGRLILVDSNGSIKTYLGGTYFISLDNRYLFSVFDADLNGVTVFDREKHKMLFTSDSLKFYLADFYVNNQSYFATIPTDEKITGKTDIATFDFKKYRFLRTTVDDNYIEKSKKLKAYNKFERAPCYCGRTK